MIYKIKIRDEHFENDETPRRILALDGGGSTIGMKVDDISKMYLDLGQRVFKKSRWRRGVLRALYDEQALIKIGELVGEMEVDAKHFPANFELAA